MCGAVLHCWQTARLYSHLMWNSVDTDIKEDKFIANDADWHFVTFSCTIITFAKQAAWRKHDIHTYLSSTSLHISRCFVSRGVLRCNGSLSSALLSVPLTNVNNTREHTYSRNERKSETEREYRRGSERRWVNERKLREKMLVCERERSCVCSLVSGFWRLDGELREVKSEAQGTMCT